MEPTENPPVTARKVAVNERMKVMPTLFGTRFMQVEQSVYRLMEQFYPDYRGGYWEYYTLSNSSFYMVPRREDKLHLYWPGNGFEGEVGADAAGIIACLFVYSALSFQGCEDCSDMYHRLLDYADMHPEAAASSGRSTDRERSSRSTTGAEKMLLGGSRWSA